MDSGYRTLGPRRATSKPYQIKGVWYYPQHHYEFQESGVASYYGGKDGCHGLPTATGEAFDMYGLTAAHKTLPLPSVILVTNLENGRMLKLKVNDRGPFKNNRILDVSTRAAQLLGFYRNGTAMVEIQALPEESLCLPENLRAFAKKGQIPVFRGGSKQVVSKQLPAVVARKKRPDDPLVPIEDSVCLNNLIERTAPKPSVESLLEQSVHLKDPALETRGLCAKPFHPRLYVQVETHTTFASAQKALRNLKGFPGKSHIKKQSTPHGTIYRLVLGSFKHVKEADQALDQLLTQGHHQASISIEH